MSDEGGELAEPRRSGKSEAAFRTISEVADELEVPQHVLRFWEGRFPQVRPLKRGGGRRYYRPEDVALLRRIRDLLYREGYTIKGAQKALRDGGAAGAVDLPLSADVEEAEPDVDLGPDADDGRLFPSDDDEEAEDADLVPPPVVAPSSPDRPVPVTPRPITPVPPPEPPRLRSEVRLALGEILDELEALRGLLPRA